MPPFNQSIPLLKRPKYAEGSPLTSTRDDRDNSQIWKKGDLNTGQIDGMNLALQKMSREVAKAKRRIVGGHIPVLPAMFLVKDDLGSCLQCNAWDGTNEGAVTYVAKKHSIRILNTGDVQSGVTYTYAFAQGAADSTSLSGDVVTALLGGVGDGSGTPNIIGNDVAAMHYWTRTETGSDGSTENDVITPPFLFNCIIYAVPIAPETLDGQTCSWLEKTGREWGIKNS